MPTDEQIEAVANIDWLRMVLIADIIELQIWRETFPRRAMEIHDEAKRRAALESAEKGKTNEPNEGRLQQVSRHSWSIAGSL